MKKIIFSGILLISLLVFAIPVGAKVERVISPWNLTGTYVIDFTCTSGCSGVYSHTMNVTSMNLVTGDFSGDGFYNANYSYTWNVSGNVTGSNVTFTIVYTGSNVGYTVNVTGSIADNGIMSGTATGPGQSFTWTTSSGSANQEIYKSHGQYVRSQENKQEAAQSRIGMPVQSKGHEE